MDFEFKDIEKEDGEIAAAIKAELNRQRSNIELIASENFVSPAVMEAMGTPLTNKYAEGYPGKRYYGGCAKVDIVENLAIERAKKLFGCDHVNVQPHSGASANTAVYFALIKPGDTILGMNLAHGGHLSHGSPVNISGKYFHVVPYGVNDDGYIDYEELERIANEAKPKLIVAGASAKSQNQLVHTLWLILHILQVLLQQAIIHHLFLMQTLLQQQHIKLSEAQEAV